MKNCGVRRGGQIRYPLSQPAKQSGIPRAGSEATDRVRKVESAGELGLLEDGWVGCAGGKGPPRLSRFSDFTGQRCGEWRRVEGGFVGSGG